ncbi:MOSC domain-containing protein [Alphaproteobacteria bacterium]|jgi:uncharacterized protein YcbX|nr:MOSC domain-containing protein [Alphaproteobacteria bacterium]MDB0013609.1 MOSC domain-containing protein [Alphaproteobacteria bacterium]MDG2489253.1 MOSC domain-containing protein [Alphaproteobacteria bacterium]HBV78580.1 hypothetical protein [Alphaproteobacteria bacterium]
MQIHELWHYPVKGLGGNQMPSARLRQGGYFPNDRQFAISIGSEKAAAASDGTWLPKAHFLQLMSHELLAEYSCRYCGDAANPKLELRHQGAICLSIDPTQPADCLRLEDFFFTLLGSTLRGKPRFMKMNHQAYSDQSTALISIASTASLDAFADATNTKPDSRRFRINIIIDGEMPFAEDNLIGKTLRCGDALLLVKKSVGRCTAINVDPATAKRSPDDYVRFMKAHFGHSNLGIFAEVINGGMIKIGDRLQPA